MLKKFFEDWTIFEKCLFTLSPIIILVVGIVFKSDALTIIASILGVMSVLLLAKGLILGQFFALVVCFLYSAVSYFNGFYGEMIIYLGISLPMHIWCIIEWFKHRNDKTKSVEVNSIKAKEWIFVCIGAVIVFIGFYFLLKALNTNELLVSTISVLSGIFGIYFHARRSKFGFASYIANDIILIVLWGIPVFSGNIAMLAMFINPIINLINDSYGVFNWTRLQKRQMENTNL